MWFSIFKLCILFLIKIDLSVNKTKSDFRGSNSKNLILTHTWLQTLNCLQLIDKIKIFLEHSPQFCTRCTCQSEVSGAELTVLHYIILLIFPCSAAGFSVECWPVSTIFFLRSPYFDFFTEHGSENSQNHLKKNSTRNSALFLQFCAAD